MLAQERRLGVKRGEQAALDDGDIGRVEHAFETVLGIERLGQVQDVPVGILRRADDELGALSGGGEGGRVLILRELGLALARLIADEPHRAQNGAHGLVRGQRPQPLLGRKLDVDAQPVGQHPQPVHQLRRRAGDGLGVDVAVEAIVLAQDTQCLDHLFGCVVRAAQDTRGEEQPLDIVAAVELDRQLGQLLRREGGAARVVRAAVDAVAAVVDAGVGHQHLQQRDAPPVGREAVAAAGDGGGGIADFAGLKAAADAAGGAGGVIFGRIREDGQLLQQIHGSSGAAAALRLVEPVDQVDELGGEGSGAEKNHKQSESHGEILQ